MTTSCALQPSTAFLPACASGAEGVPWAEMVSHRSALIRFAQRKLHDPVLAEDVVHDVFEAVLAGRARFAGRSALRSWLTGILKNKIVDLIRQRAVYAELDATDDSEDTPASAQLECPHPRPDQQAEQREWLAHTLDRIAALPCGLRDAMTLRVLQDQPSDAVCRTLAISEDNLFVRLHRARKHLVS